VLINDDLEQAAAALAAIVAGRDSPRAPLPAALRERIAAILGARP
jgi:hypothetical protein